MNRTRNRCQQQERYCYSYHTAYWHTDLGGLLHKVMQSHVDTSSREQSWCDNFCGQVMH